MINASINGHVYLGVRNSKILKVGLFFFLVFFLNLIPVQPNIPGPHLQNQGPHRTNSSQRHGSSPPPGLAKWFGSDVLEQPLPSMPTKVISVDELELRP